MSELGDLLELIYGAGERWRTVRLTLREWQHSGRIREAIERQNAKQASRRVGRITVYGETSGPEPEEIEHVVRVWLDGDRAREEREGPHAFPALGVRDGTRWWQYSKEYGASSNESEPDVQSAASAPTSTSSSSTASAACCSGRRASSTACR